MQRIVQKILAALARVILNKYKPRIIGITGSIGKTSAKEAIAAVLSEKFRLRQTEKNYNNELGVPLTIIGAPSGGRSLVGWGRVLARALKLIFFRIEYPEVLVLEMGADKPGDIEYLINIAPVSVGVVTRVAPVHTEFFGSLEKIALEKRKVVTELNRDGVAVLNADDELVMAMAKQTKGQVISFGYSESADVRAIELENQGAGTQIEGVRFKLSARGSVVPVFLPHVIGAHQIYAALAAAAVGLGCGLNLIDVAEGLKKYQAPKGRMNLITGVNNSLIIDDTYNSSPVAALAAVESVGKLNLEGVNRKIAIVGDMLELGDISEEAHEELGRAIANNKFSVLVAVGHYRSAIIRGAREAGLTEIYEFESSREVSKKIKPLIVAGDVILVKGSQGARMERVVKGLMADPSRAGDLLVRQGAEWQS